MKSITVGITGASGALYGARMLHHLHHCEDVDRVNLVITNAGRRVLTEELDIAPGLDKEELVAALVGQVSAKLRYFPVADIGAKLASGSYPVDGMVIIPCSMGTLASIANGVTRDLVHRAADVTLKENRPLVIVPRETPLNAIHLENLLKLSRIGVRVVAAMPSFYHRPQTIIDLVDHIVFRVMDQFGLPHSKKTMWTGSSGAAN
jgi:4-hydroxy-3-polyprenylbenzoate decarboxylase